MRLAVAAARVLPLVVLAWWEGQGVVVVQFLSLLGLGLLGKVITAARHPVLTAVEAVVHPR